MLVGNAGIATILSGQTTSAAVDLGQRVLTALIMPAAWTAADITFEGSTDSGGTFNAVKRADGTTTAIAAFIIKTPSASDYIVFNPGDFAGLRYIKIVSSASQGADRAIQLIGGIMQ